VRYDSAVFGALSSIMSSSYQLDYAKCPRGHLTPIQPSTPQSVEAYRVSIETGTYPLLVACIRCSRMFWVHQLHTRQSTQGLFPDDPSTQLRVFEESIGCDDPTHQFHHTVRGVRNENTSVSDLKKKWVWAQGEDSKCPEGHKIPLPPFED
jgi:hypothetical protein